MSIGKQNQRDTQKFFLNTNYSYHVLRKQHHDYSSSDMTAGNEAHFLSKCPSEPATSKSLSTQFHPRQGTKIGSRSKVERQIKVQLLLYAWCSIRFERNPCVVVWSSSKCFLDKLSIFHIFWNVCLCYIFCISYILCIFIMHILNSKNLFIAF